MKILYDDKTGKIYYTVKDSEYFYFTHTANIPLTEFEIDEINPENKDTCIDLEKTQMKIDSNGEGKYYIESEELYEKDGWEEFLED